MSELTVLEAITAAMADSLEADSSVVVLGEDVGVSGGIFRATQGLQQQFGPQRVIDTPLDEKGIVAHAVGMALYGLRPIVEVQFSGFIHDAFEQIMFCASKYRWMTGGEYSCPMVLRAPSYGGIKGGFWHSQSPEAYFTHGGGIKVLTPTTPDDCYRSLLAAVADPDPVLVIEPVPLYRSLRGEVERDGKALEPGTSRTVRAGRDVTVLTWGPQVLRSVEAAEALAADGIDVEVLDLRSLVPLDVDAIVASVQRTGRVLIVHEAARTGGFGAELATLVQEKAFGYLHAPIERVTGHDVPYNFSTGDEYYRPDVLRITAGIKRLTEFEF
ncbi:2-oxoisovalerate dehydrogenase subunit beta [Nocardioides dokdonensis FR1436]|uniref:2-oxoisovalerate dehydrogenase subunit beta n=1 Tax=Nocardioides dokdonensis FR1436 TaxID=1300347 RepID=A0A1A9GH35_9ACTN|nr:alpha-ketoacid dehydrogenase subunit beta [Nocardioides dokdonensis]ANH37629.1 2-oxoisovalerate dehydrogenase subunit beta [Nocardioides dokdonensis FR1436]